MRSSVALILCLIGSAMASEVKNKITVEGMDVPSVNLPWDVSPEACPSKTYKWNGRSFECLNVDIVDILKTQRNINFLGMQACEKEVEFLRAVQVRDAKHQAAQEKCREKGKRFDAAEVECGAALPQKKELETQ